MSFTRQQYEECFQFALRIYRHTRLPLQAEAALQMWRVEDVIGQQSEFPTTARLKYPRSFFGSRLPHITEVSKRAP